MLEFVPLPAACFACPGVAAVSSASRLLCPPCAARHEAETRVGDTSECVGVCCGVQEKEQLEVQGRVDAVMLAASTATAKYRLFPSRALALAHSCALCRPSRASKDSLGTVGAD